MLDFEVTSQSLTVVSSDPEAINLVSGENSADLTQFEWAPIANMNLRSCNWKHLIFLSSDPESNKEPSVDNETDLTGAE